MKRLLIVFSAIAMLFILSCKKDSQSYSSPFEGNYKGDYMGAGDDGTFKFLVDSAGNISGTVTSTAYDTTFQGTGTVATNGQLTVTIGAITSGATFIGTMRKSDVSGTWVNQSYNGNGTWGGAKE
jgi:hypothetical protein